MCGASSEGGSWGASRPHSSMSYPASVAALTHWSTCGELRNPATRTRSLSATRRGLQHLGELLGTRAPRVPLEGQLPDSCLVGEPVALPALPEPEEGICDRGLVVWVGDYARIPLTHEPCSKVV